MAYSTISLLSILRYLNVLKILGILSYYNIVLLYISILYKVITLCCITMYTIAKKYFIHTVIIIVITTT